MVRTMLAVMLALVVVAQAEDVKYSTLAKEGHVVDLGIKVSFQDKSNEAVTPFNGGKPCPIADDTCRTPIFGYDEDTKLTLGFKAPAKMSTLNKLGEKVVGKPVDILFKACYAPEWIKDRKWRKAKDVISKDKRCLKKIATVPIDAESLTYTFPSNTPKAEWFITAYVRCEAPDGDTPIVCAMDTTGGLGLLTKEKAPAGTEKSAEIFYKTEVTESRTTGLVAAVIILSICSVSLLVGFFIYEHLTQKNK